MLLGLDLNIDGGISHQSDSGLYIINQHQEHETPNLPVNLNILDFSAKVLDFKYKVTLFCDNEEGRILSKEFKSKILIYYVYYIGAFAIKLMSEILLNNEYGVPSSHLYFHIIASAFLLVLSFVILLLMYVSSSALLYNRETYTILGILTVVYYCVGEESVLSGITTKSYDHQFPSSVIYIISLIIVTKSITFNCFKYTTLLSVFSCLFYLIISLVFSDISAYTITSDFLMMLLILTLQMFDSHQIDYRTRQLFYRKLKEEECSKPTNYPISESRVKKSVNSEVELIVQCCDHVKNHIKNAASIIMFNDLKQDLKEAANEIEKIKRRVAHGSFLADIKIESNMDLDEDDRQFLTQMFSELKTPTRRSRRPSIQQMMENTVNFPFSDYGIAELESVLSTIGKN